MRRKRAPKRESKPDPKYNSPLVGKFINIIMR
ncbi:MAG TPA: 30S ribosomal protein S7, partial [Candidatus Aerophobetes bacterium]|nr:30S ribosomal protein S7 [Candidatus Aerophobetes bacterium]